MKKVKLVFTESASGGHTSIMVNKEELTKFSGYFEVFFNFPGNDDKKGF